MARLDWNALGARYFELGVDRGVLYVADQPGVAWTGLISVQENPSGGDPRPFYIDGVKYLNIPAAEEFQATITAFTYPPVFGTCDGTAQINSGLFITHQPRKSFGFSYRSIVGNDLSGSDYGYKIHIVYNALAAPSQRDNTTLGDSADPSPFAWDITTKPPAMAGYKRTAHIIVDSRYTNPVTMSAVEDILYGSASDSARLPGLAELIELFADNTILTVTDHGDGTYSVNGPDSAIQMLDDSNFQITWASAIYIDADTYTISSL